MVIFFLNCGGSCGFSEILGQLGLLGAEVTVQVAILAVLKQQVEVALVFEFAFAADDSRVGGCLLQLRF